MLTAIIILTLLAETVYIIHLQRVNERLKDEKEKEKAPCCEQGAKEV